MPTTKTQIKETVHRLFRTEFDRLSHEWEQEERKDLIKALYGIINLTANDIIELASEMKSEL